MRTYGKKIKGKPRRLSPAEMVIEAFGGPSKLAKLLFVTAQVVCNWRRAGVVPAKYRADVAMLVNQHKININGRYIWAKTNDIESATVPTESN